MPLLLLSSLFWIVLQKFDCSYTNILIHWTALRTTTLSRLQSVPVPLSYPFFRYSPTSLSITCYSLVTECWQSFRHLAWDEFASVEVFEQKLPWTRRLVSLRLGEYFSWPVLHIALESNPNLIDLCIEEASPLDSGAPPPAQVRNFKLQTLRLNEVRWVTEAGIAYLASACPYITFLTLHIIPEDPIDLSSLKSLVHLEILSVHITAIHCLDSLLPEADDATLLWPRLHKLQLRDFYAYDVQFALLFSARVRDLTLVGHFSPEFLEEVLESLKDIETLYLRGVDNIHSRTLALMTPTALSSLRRLHVDACAELSSPSFNNLLDSMPNLTDLTVEDCPDIVINKWPKSLLTLRESVKERNAM